MTEPTLFDMPEQAAPVSGPVLEAAQHQNVVTWRTNLVPVGQPRVQGRFNKGLGRVQMFEKTTIGKKGEPNRPHPIVQYRYNIEQDARVAMAGRAPLTGPVACILTLVFARPSNMVWKRRPMPRVPQTGRPDADNVAKAVMDAVGTSGVVFSNDAKVARLVVEKWIAAGDEVPHTQITFAEWRPEGMAGATDGG